MKNKACVKGSICNAYLVEEASLFCSYYFEEHVHTRHRRVLRNNDVCGENWEENKETLSIFKYPGRAFGHATSRQLSLEKFHATHAYILLNCSEVDPYNKYSLLIR